MYLNDMLEHKGEIHRFLKEKTLVSALAEICTDRYTSVHLTVYLSGYRTVTFGTVHGQEGQCTFKCTPVQFVTSHPESCTGRREVHVHSARPCTLHARLTRGSRPFKSYLHDSSANPSLLLLKSLPLNSFGPIFRRLHSTKTNQTQSSSNQPGRFSNFSPNS